MSKFEDEINEQARIDAREMVRAFDLKPRNQLFLDEMIAIGCLYTKFTEIQSMKTIAEIIEKIMKENDPEFKISEYALETEEKNNKIIYTFSDNSKLEIKDKL